jgi:hypothetical protein
MPPRVHNLARTSENEANAKADSGQRSAETDLPSSIFHLLPAGKLIADS